MFIQSLVIRECEYNRCDNYLYVYMCVQRVQELYRAMTLRAILGKNISFCMSFLRNKVA